MLILDKIFHINYNLVIR